MISMHVINEAFNIIPSNEDIVLHAKNCDPKLITERLGELVPLFRFAECKVEEATSARAVLTAPLQDGAMNQNGTHQASVFYLMADYALGVAMFAAVPGIYTVGVHDRCNALPVQMWLRNGRVTHLAPGTGAIRAVAELDQPTVEDMRKSLASKGRCVVKGEVKIFQSDRLVALCEHEIGMYADLPRATHEKASAGQIEKMKLSALMIAGLRGDSLSDVLAGEQGIAIGKRMSNATPQLPSLVRARTKYARDTLKAEKFDQVLVLGAGLDTKPVELADSGERWFLADLPEMLMERDARLQGMDTGRAEIVPVPLDFRMADWPSELLAAGFDPHRRTFVLLEGVSMYLAKKDLCDTLKKLALLCKHSDSRLWIDHVTDTLFGMDDPEVTAFLSSMSRLGEPFITGFDDFTKLGMMHGWELAASVSAAEVAGRKCNVHNQYRFSVLKRGQAHLEVADTAAEIELYAAE